jgi:hypothetical protein
MCVEAVDYVTSSEEWMFGGQSKKKKPNHGRTSKAAQKTIYKKPFYQRLLLGDRIDNRR